MGAVGAFANIENYLFYCLTNVPEALVDKTHGYHDAFCFEQETLRFLGLDQRAVA